MMLRYCIFDGEELTIVSSTESEDGHAHAICFKCDRAYRFITEIHLAKDSSLIFLEKTYNSD